MMQLYEWLANVPGMVIRVARVSVESLQAPSQRLAMQAEMTLTREWGPSQTTMLCNFDDVSRRRVEGGCWAGRSDQNMSVCHINNVSHPHIVSFFFIFSRV